MNLVKYLNDLLDAVEVQIATAFSNYEKNNGKNYFKYGVVDSIDTVKNQYNVKINGEIYHDLPSDGDKLYQIGDLVSIMVPNSNLNECYIHGKKNFKK